MLAMFADILVTVPQTIVAGIAIGKYIESKRIPLLTVLMTLINMTFYILSGYVMENGAWLRSVCGVCIPVVMVIIFSEIPRVRGIIYYAISQVIMILVEIPVDMVLFRMVPDFQNVATAPLELYILLKLTYLPLLCLSYILPYWFCTRFFKKNATSELNRYMPFLLVQVPVVVIPIVMTITITNNYLFVNLLAALYLTANLLLDILLLRTFERLNNAHELELQQEQAQSMIQAQADYYTQLRDSAKVTRQLRHDMNNQLQTLSILLEEGDLHTAMEQLSSYREEIRSSGEKRHTGNPVVDAVIQAKLDTCMETGITISCTGTIPEDLNIKAVNLCSVAANLLDNAIHAVEKLPPHREQHIDFSANIQENKVIFLCRNPIPPDTRLQEKEPQLQKEHGWGLSILRRIAAEYNGDMSIHTENGTVTITVWLTIP